MDKQKVIDELKIELGRWKAEETLNSKMGLRGVETFAKQRVFELETALDIARKLEEPRKVVVPQFVADWFEENKHELELRIFSLVLDCYEKSKANESCADIEKWLGDTLNNPIETLIRMKDGYEVEKEPLYRVIIPFKKTVYKYAFINEKGHHRTTDSFALVSKLTEAQIKAIDATFWKIAVPVEE